MSVQARRTRFAKRKVGKDGEGTGEAARVWVSAAYQKNLWRAKCRFFFSRAARIRSAFVTVL